MHFSFQIHIRDSDLQKTFDETDHLEFIAHVVSSIFLKGPQRDRMTFNVTCDVEPVDMKAFLETRFFQSMVENSHFTIEEGGQE